MQASALFVHGHMRISSLKEVCIYLENDVFNASDSYIVDHMFNATNELFIWASRYNSHSERGERVPASQTEKPHADTARAEKTSGSLTRWE